MPTAIYEAEITLAAIRAALSECTDALMRRTLAGEAQFYRDMLKGWGA